MMKNPKIFSVTIGPENIDEHIALCKSNRAREKRHINTFVRLIKQGNFRNGGIIFADTRGNYHDGQHRLYALKITGHTAQFFVVQNLDRTDLNMMVDSGKKRANSARLKATGVKYAGTICSAIEEIIEIKEHWRQQSAMLMADEVLGYLNKHPDLHSLAANWSSSQGREDVPGVTIKTLVAFQHLLTQIDTEKSDQFFRDLTHRSLLKPGQPVHAFYSMLESETLRIDPSTSRVTKYIRNGLIIAWNAFFKGEQLDHITPTDRQLTLDGIPVAPPEPFAAEDDIIDHDGNDDGDDDSTEGATE
jgi:hypothetical protein